MDGHMDFASLFFRDFDLGVFRKRQSLVAVCSRDVPGLRSKTSVTWRSQKSGERFEPANIS